MVKIRNFGKERARLRTSKVKNAKTRQAVMDELLPRHLDGTISRHQANLLLMALEEEKRSRVNVSPAVDAVITKLRKDTNLKARINKKPKSF